MRGGLSAQARMTTFDRNRRQRAQSPCVAQKRTTVVITIVVTVVNAVVTTVTTVAAVDDGDDDGDDGDDDDSGDHSAMPPPRPLHTRARRVSQERERETHNASHSVHTDTEHAPPPPPPPETVQLATIPPLAPSACLAPPSGHNNLSISAIVDSSI